MKQGLLIAGLLLLAGCAEVKEYSDVIAHPAPAGLTGYWQSVGPQSELISPEAQASLVVTPDGTTLDCRQWQRVIAVSGKLSLKSDGESWQNRTEKGDIYSLAPHDSQLRYAGMTLQRVSKLTSECTQALQTLQVVTEQQPPS
ncbi:lipoprotein YedD [Klebsiella sp. BIGb0407]|uniref:lipoprotein YedD n=1 Tax=Klebsiella sp. BIGb0407 TaxID=2940603 RepID=UPI00216A4961|nr:lipoprotein YedD [Klebsiella sp. BIGb0407]MCS3431508.1 hypothetical protein [Klebsiella sp. BIGb0407]